MSITSIKGLLCWLVQGVQLGHRGVKILEPWGILVAVIALFFTLAQFESDRRVRTANMIGLIADRLESARALQRAEGKVAKDNTGQVRILNIIANLEIDLSDMDLSELNLRGADLRGSILKNVDLTCSNLTKANLIGVDLTDTHFTSARLFKTKIANAVFQDADLGGADLNSIDSIAGADFTNATFRNTRLRNLDLRRTKGITDHHLLNSCGYDVEFPSNISPPVIAAFKHCSQEQRRDQKCSISESRIQTHLKKIRKELRDIRRALK